MVKVWALSAILFVAMAAAAQKTEQGFDYAFKPTTSAPRYYVITEKNDSLWHRQAYYLPERGKALDGWYKDEEGEVPHGTIIEYYPNKRLHSNANYIDGKLEGTKLEFDEGGFLIDSANYTGGKLTGVEMRWYKDGMPRDSIQLDGAGNGVEVSWYENGAVFAAGHLIQDTLKTGPWKYYHPNGQVAAAVNYEDGDIMAAHCFDAKGAPLPPNECTKTEASFPGGKEEWQHYLSSHLDPKTPIYHQAPLGVYTVVISFMIDTSGNVSDIKPITHFGFGMEEEVIRLVKKSPKWIPAQQFGIKVKAYRKQPITFSVSNS